MSLDPRIEALATRIKILERQLAAIVNHLSPNIEYSYLEDKMIEIKKEVLEEEG